MFDVAYTNKDKLVARFGEMPEKLHASLLKRVHGLTLELKNHVILDKLQGQVLNKITGRLMGSIQSDVTDTPDRITGRVYSSTTASPYNRAHEYGAIIPDRFPKNAKAMHWMVGGQHVFAKFARGFTLPARSYMRSSLTDYKEKIINTLRKAREAVAK